MNSIFDLKKSIGDLENTNHGVSKVMYEQATPSRDVTTTNFPNGAIHIRWQVTGQRHWVPSRSFLAIRCKLEVNHAANTPEIPLAADNIAPSMGFASNLFQSAEFRINDKTVSHIPDFLPQIDVLHKRMNKSKSWMDSVGRSTNFWSSNQEFNKSLVQSDGTGLGKNEFEVIWQPPLSIFQVGHAMPAGSYELILNPQGRDKYKKFAIESTGADKVAGDAINNFLFEVQNMHMYVGTVEGMRVDNTSYLLDLNEIRCQAVNITGTNGQTKNFDVAPSTHAITVAVQERTAGENTLYGATKFKCQDSEEQKIKSLRLQYAGQTKPSPDPEIQYEGGQDYLTQRYAETLISTGAYFDNGGAEDKTTDFLSMGPYYNFSWAKDGTDRSTRLDVYTKFSAMTAGRLLVFDHSKSVGRVEVKEGRVVSVQIEQA
jgi:hypothetical protein